MLLLDHLLYRLVHEELQALDKTDLIKAVNLFPVAGVTFWLEDQL